MKFVLTHIFLASNNKIMAKEFYALKGILVNFHLAVHNKHFIYAKFMENKKAFH